MHANQQLVHDFYTAFQRRDGAAMAACYQPDVHFSDPVFVDLRGPRAGAMWQMLCARAEDLEIEYGDVTADDTVGRAHWEARYTFSTGRKVHNRIDAAFAFQDGLIIRHTDAFDLHVWAAQALGWPGRLLGGTERFQDKIRASAMDGLERYVAGSAST
ncbi:MAG: nuclear transport factor 2 family protein [Actinobacteria bacterium]|nr:nuclear transport factor 2 family protein [Actinomycetota bacterium]